MEFYFQNIGMGILGATFNHSYPKTHWGIVSFMPLYMNKVLIDFNGMSTCLGLFYTRFGNKVHCTFILTLCNCFLCLFFFFFFFFFAYCLWNMTFLKLIDLTPTGMIILGQSGPSSNSNEGVLHISQSSRSEASPSDAVQCHTQDSVLGCSIKQQILSSC